MNPVEIIALHGCSRPEDGHPCKICVGQTEEHVRAVESAGLLVVSVQERGGWRERAEKAEAAVARARKLAEELQAEAEQGAASANIDSLCAAWKGSGHAAGLVLAALDDTAGT